MTNNAVWPSPDQQVAGQGRQDVHGVYLLDPTTNKAVSPTGGGGGGGAVTVADGADVAQGTTTQTKATDGSATSWSEIQLLKGIFDKLLNSIVVGGTITEANSAASKADLDSILTQVTNHTETNSAAILAKLVAAPALEGGHLATIDTSTAASKTDLDSIVTNTNKIPASPAQEAGNLATIATNTSNTATNTSASKTDLDTIAGAISSTKMQANVAQIGGQAPTLDNTTIQAVSLRGKGAGTAGDTAVLLDSAGRIQQVQILGTTALSDINPEPNISNIQQMILNGKAYSCSTGLVTAAANEACSFFVPNTNTTKNILIWSVRLMYSNASQTTDMRLITADDTNITGGTSDAGNVTNLKVGGSASGSSFAMHHASAVTAPASSASTLPLDEILNPVNATVECLAPGMFIYVPPSTAGGVALYSATTAAGKWQVVIRWVEY